MSATDLTVEQLQQRLSAMEKEVAELVALNARLTIKIENERTKCAAKDEELVFLKHTTPTARSESEETGDEFIINSLIKKVDQLKKEKESLLLSLEQEEEYVSNTLTIKLEKVRREKIEMENLLEQEQEFIVNRLQKQIEAKQHESNRLESQLQQMRKEMVDLENALEQEAECMVNRLQKKLEEMEVERSQLVKQLSESPSSSRLTRQKSMDNNFQGIADQELIQGLRQALLDNEDAQTKRALEYEAEKKKLQDDNMHLQQLYERQKEQVGSLTKNMTRMEVEMEQEEEKQFNMLTSPTTARKNSFGVAMGMDSPRNLLLQIDSKSTPGDQGISRSRSLSDDIPLSTMEAGTKWWAHRSTSSGSSVTDLTAGLGVQGTN
eukprot:CFRG4593T1